MKQTVPVSCPYCGEPVDLLVDEGGGPHQQFVEDCYVCCQPWEVHVVQEPDGEWSAEVRTTDE